MNESPIKDIFDLNDLSDVSKEIRKELNVLKETDRLLSLFKIANRELNTNELIVGYYRKFGVALTKKQMYMKIWLLARTKKIEQVSRGVYRLKELNK